MPKNMSKADRTIRIILGIIALALAVFITTGGWSILLYVLAAIFIVTSLVGTCLLYIPFKINTNK
ncbi:MULTISPECIES: DUF2892 domain-containing protein [Dehalococcoides]|jgi:fatty acid desaturase|uniref:Putative membrane protein n=2 Tax=Dehalococcoides mccartyi TaxID=61435 RepID=A0A142VAP4_9CHLR|nr:MULTISPECIES: DUF2892 domain-containing protein [Dehalococcoides]AGG06710.1 hypothetical protein dcmb_1110 [Dehalococcoides mccartyi DCMB5]AGG08205.1 hypothetical protein btf_1129 [Dehalococcoides mccartyi BTF08]AII61209.1 hypothetical protein X794_05220 [Dehalococcoides mccartyi CG5]AMU86904.1 hypothetical protein Dm11a5_1078 [Dehalococcoides mccartyi]AOV99694.1 membrane protein [Dehalococcoides mccartyi]